MDNLDKTVSNKKLKHAAEEWRATFDAINDMISIHDKDYNILRANKAFSAVFNMKPTEVLGKKCYELIHGNKRTAIFLSS